LQDNAGYYIAKDKVLYARNTGAPLVYGAESSTKIYPKDGPSLIVPGFGVMNESGKYREATVEFWLRADRRGSEPRRIFGPIGEVDGEISTDGLYINGSFLTLKLGQHSGSHFVNEWGRPMLINLRLSEQSASIVLNGEEVVLLSINAADISFPAKFKTVLNDIFDQDWLGFYGYSDILAYELVKMSPPNPWILHSGDLDAIAVEGEVMRSDAIMMGLRSDIVHATGIIQHDEMKWRVDNKENQRSNLYRQLNFSANKPLLLSALPPDFLYSVNGKPQCPNCDFKTYSELVEFWVTSIAQLSQFNIVITVHPSVNPENLKFIEKWGVRISQERTSDLMPLCDLFVASISATINWAIACGKPVINYDVYRYRYTDYVNASGVLTMEEKNEFLSTLFKLNDAEFLSQLTDKQVKEAASWARLDGLAAERILALVYENVN